MLKLSTLQAVLANPQMASKLETELLPHLQENESLQELQGSTIPIHVESDSEFELSLSDVGTLFSLLIDGQLTGPQLAYVADAIELSEGVTYDGSPIADFLGEMTDPKVNGIFTKERAEEIRKWVCIQQMR